MVASSTSPATTASPGPNTPPTKSPKAIRPAPPSAFPPTVLSSPSGRLITTSLAQPTPARYASFRGPVASGRHVATPSSANPPATEADGARVCRRMERRWRLARRIIMVPTASEAGRCAFINGAGRRGGRSGLSISMERRGRLRRRGW